MCCQPLTASSSHPSSACIRPGKLVAQIALSNIGGDNMNWKGYARLFVMIFASLSGLYSQTYQGTISGTVTDKTGAVVAGATVTVTDPGKGVSRVLKTNGAGQYFAPNLEPGTYTFTAQAPDFQRIEKSGVMLDVGKSLRVDFVLPP